MDISLKGLEPEVVDRLAEQARIEGVSAQEWMREALRRTAALLTPSELVARAGERTPISEAEFRSTAAQLDEARAAQLRARVEAERVRHRGR